MANYCKEKVWRAIVLRVVIVYLFARWKSTWNPRYGEQTKFHFSQRDLKRRKINLADENDSLLQQTKKKRNEDDIAT